MVSGVADLRPGRQEGEADATAAEDAGEHGESIPELLSPGPQESHQDRLGVSPGDGAVAAPDLAVDRCRTHGLLGAIIGRVDVRGLQEGEQLPAMLVQVLGQPLVIGVGLSPAEHSIELGFQATDGHARR